MRSPAKHPVKNASDTASVRIRYIVNITYVAFAIFITIALCSYNSHDAGFTKTTAVNSYIANSEGIVGAYVADLLLYFLGVSAFVLPIIFASISYLRSSYSTYSINIYTVLGTLMLFASINGLLAIHVSSFSFLPSGIGGALGEYIAWKSVGVLNIVGASFILTTVLIFAIIIIKPDINFSALFSYIKNINLKIPNFSFNFTLPEFFKNTNKSTLIAEDEPSEVILPPKEEPVSVAINETPVQPQTPPQMPIVAKEQNTVNETSNIQMQRSVNTNHYARVEMPAAELLDIVEKNQRVEIAKSVIINLSKDVEKKFLDFGFKLDVVAVYPGPVVTRFELKLAPGTKVSSISNLAKDLSRTLSVTSVRIVDVIPGKSVIGLEIPNAKRQIVRLRDLISSNSYISASSPVTIVLGKDISGHPVVVDLAKMPHLLVAGTTGSGKSVGLNAMLLSFLYKSSAEKLRLILIDPKMLELSVYDDIPHLLTPVITDMGEAAGALRWCVAEMERRYKLMSVLGVRNIAGYNEKVAKANREGSPLLDPLYMSDDGSEPPPLENLPAIVVVADEYADMIMVLGKKVEQLIARLAQKARAAGIHLVLATQRPSVNVVTGLIKANIPTRIAFQVSSRIDSRTVLDQQGAEQLLGHGDMLYLPPGTGVPVRVHGAYVSDDEVHRVVKFIKDNNPPPEYVNNLIDNNDLTDGDEEGDLTSADNGEKDALYDEAVSIVAKTKKVSISSIQRKLKIGYNRSANIVEAMEKAGVVSAPAHNGTREVLIDEIKV